MKFLEFDAAETQRWLERNAFLKDRQTFDSPISRAKSQQERTLEWEGIVGDMHLGQL